MAPRQPLSRRAFLTLAGLGTLAPFLNACSSPRDGSNLDRAERLIDLLTAGSGPVRFGNRPHMIDRTTAGTHPSLDMFTLATGIPVEYRRSVRDDAAFIRRIRPALAAGKPTAYDLIVLRNGPDLSELIGRAWLRPLDHALLPNFAELASEHVRDPAWDLGNQYSVAWQSGLTGIAFTPEAVEALGREPASIRDLWSSPLAGRVGMLRDLQDVGSFGVLALGGRPETSPPESWNEAAEMLRRQRDAVVRGYYTDGYIDALRRRSLWISQARSGDVLQAIAAGDRDLRFVVPREGAMLWTQSMVVPYTAEHPAEAMMLMDFVYRPYVAALIAQQVRYISPVPAAKAAAPLAGDRAVANSPLVFPPLEGEDRPFQLEPRSDGTRSVFAGTDLVDYYTFVDPTQAAEWRRVFGPIVEGG